MGLLFLKLVFTLRNMEIDHINENNRQGYDMGHSIMFGFWLAILYYGLANFLQTNPTITLNNPFRNNREEIVNPTLKEMLGRNALLFSSQRQEQSETLTLITASKLNT